MSVGPSAALTRSGRADVGLQSVSQRRDGGLRRLGQCRDVHGAVPLHQTQTGPQRVLPPHTRTHVFIQMAGEFKFESGQGAYYSSLALKPVIYRDDLRLTVTHLLSLTRLTGFEVTDWSGKVRRPAQQAWISTSSYYQNIY